VRTNLGSQAGVATSSALQGAADIWQLKWRPLQKLSPSSSHTTVFFIKPGGFGYGVTQQQHQFPNFPEISNHSIMHILYTIFKATSFTQISHEQLKISKKKQRETKICSTFEFLTSTKFLAGGVKVTQTARKQSSIWVPDPCSSAF
jgi:hypothetical protein